MRDDEHGEGAERSDERPVAVENQAMRSDETVSDFGETRAKARFMEVERMRDPESGDVEVQREFLAGEAQVTDEERERRAESADIHNAPNDQHRND